LNENYDTIFVFNKRFQAEKKNSILTIKFQSQKVWSVKNTISDSNRLTKFLLKRDAQLIAPMLLDLISCRPHLESENRDKMCA